MKRLDCYLHTHRRQWGVTQEELAFLFGSKSASVVSRLERREHNPSLKAAFACQVIFGIASDELFPKLYAEVEDAVMRRAHELHERLQGTPSKATRVKLELLEDAPRRAKERADKLDV
jgi:transcriptional regulator with XRE-family HTH domain